MNWVIGTLGVLFVAFVICTISYIIGYRHHMREARKQITEEDLAAEFSAAIHAPELQSITVYGSSNTAWRFYENAKKIIPELVEEIHILRNKPAEDKLAIETVMLVVAEEFESALLQNWQEFAEYERLTDDQAKTACAVIQRYRERVLAVIAGGREADAKG